jgi:hypothetical protein
MENGQFYYIGNWTGGDPKCPILVLGYMLDGKRVEIYKSQGTYIVFNAKTKKYLTCLSLEHAHYVFKECVRMLVLDGTA